MTRRYKTFFGAALAALVLVSLAPASASASILSDCTDNGSIDGKYSPGALRDQLKDMPADVDQYYACSDLIRQELLNNVKKDDDGKGGGKGGGNAALNAATTAEQRKQAEKTAEKAVKSALPSSGAVASADGAEVERSGAKTLASSASPGTPGALVIALIGLLLLFLGDLAARGAKMPAMKKLSRKPGPTDGSN